jgi:hypothetical protein
VETRRNDTGSLLAIFRITTACSTTALGAIVQRQQKRIGANPKE